MKFQTLSTFTFMLALSLGIASAQGVAPSGPFGFLITDSFVDSGDNNGAAILGLMNFDGAGNVTGSYTLQGRGPNNQITGALTGTYSSNPDGTGSATISFDFGVTATLATAITDGGQGLQLLVTQCSPGCNIGGGVVALQGTAQSVTGTLPMSIFVDGASGGIPLTLTGTANSNPPSIVYTAAPASGNGTVQCSDGSSGTWSASVQSLSIVEFLGAGRFLLTMPYQSCGNSDGQLLSGTVDSNVSGSGAVRLTLHRPGDVLSGIARAAAPGSALNGSYGYQVGNAPLPRGAIGAMQFDGSGNMTETLTDVADGSSHGSGKPVITGTSPGTYSVNPDGTGKMSPQNDAPWAFVITDGGSGLLLLKLGTTNENDLQFGTARRQ